MGTSADAPPRDDFNRLRKHSCGLASALNCWEDALTYRRTRHCRFLIGCCVRHLNDHLAAYLVWLEKVRDDLRDAWPLEKQPHTVGGQCGRSYAEILGSLGIGLYNIIAIGTRQRTHVLVMPPMPPLDAKKAAGWLRKPPPKIVDHHFTPADWSILRTHLDLEIDVARRNAGGATRPSAPAPMLRSVGSSSSNGATTDPRSTTRCPIELRGPDKPPVLLGEEMDEALKPREYKTLESLVASYPRPLKKDDLDKNSTVTDARKVLGTLRQKDPRYAAVVQMAGPERRGYRLCHQVTTSAHLQPPNRPRQR